MASWTPELQRAYRGFKTKLTRRTRAKDWQGVIDLWSEFREYFDSRDAPWPDDWQRWERASEDADITLSRLKGGF